MRMGMNWIPIPILLLLFWFMAWDHDRWEILCSFEFGDLVLIHTHIYPTVQKFEPTLD